MSESDIAALREDNRRLEEKIDGLCDTVNKLALAFTKSSSNHSQRLKHTEDGLELAHNRISGVKKWLIGGLVGIASTAAKFAWDMAVKK